MLPMLSILMLAFSTVIIEICCAKCDERPADRSHLDDPNVHLEDLVICIKLPQPRLAQG